MPNQKRYDNLSKRQIYRQLAVQSKADLHDLHDSSLEFTNEPESADDICYIRQELPKGKNNLHVRIDDESEGTHDFIENMIEIENIQLNYENEIIQSMMSDGKYYETDSEEEFQENLVTSLEIQKLYIREIKMVGGSDPGQFTRATLHFLISNELALQYSWSGQKNTRKFRDTLISQLIVETISKIKNVPKSDIETIIKKWLQHASDRLKNRK